MTAQLKLFAKDNPERFWIEWCRSNPKSLAMARIKVSYEDTMRILQRINKGHNDIDSGIFARQNHYSLLQRMLAKQWVSESDIKPYETFVI